MIKYKDDSQVSSTTFSITKIVFSANKACVGRDVYFVCESLVASVKEPLFTFMRSISSKDNSAVGHDRTEAFGMSICLYFSTGIHLTMNAWIVILASRK
ncbi:uncharacterized protein MONOS_14133 [Monocercomonoides exilis]|uniref:uncharacterized protein n=1 Tax=Monocercomonoides exilis TaxID=2049356 RepID=UPI0035597E02|nr:hypothetical protein MONOS_14133 [Monocercomonoides exilis]|eukprot:MONOS_14133.1-p1 / transcript=MONOS_14133.1 / gene=MONOS_14133 / organism=Monocercomonoides_exilis_PA203 / gene_product=unspecified product / transcript_product=unspecified product / location=Mono_scaffold00944:4947-5243(+) / protein_length=99 / sequence_SO=supercontig / SO=protein_coding / is_pseudo=false